MSKIKLNGVAERRKAAEAHNRAIDVISIIAIVGITTLAGHIMWEYEENKILALQWIGVSLIFAVLSYLATSAASTLKADPRPEKAMLAFPARIASLCFLAVPVFIDGSAMGLRMQDKDAAEYALSASYAADTALASDQTVDSIVRAQASVAMARAIAPSQVRFDGFFLAALAAFGFMHLMPFAAGGFCRVYRPETEAEAKRRHRLVIADKARATREANAKAKTKLEEKMARNARRNRGMPEWSKAIGAKEAAH